MTIRPRMSEDGAMALIRKYAANNYDPYPIAIEETSGAWVKRPDGSRALDFLCGFGATPYHKPPKVLQAFIEELWSGSGNVSRALGTTAFAEFLQKVIAFTTATASDGTVYTFDRVLPKCEGSSVTSSAMRAMRFHAARQGIKHPVILRRKNSFHGRDTIFEEQFDLTATGLPAASVRFVEDDIRTIEETLTPNTVGIIWEIHRGEGGPLFDEGGLYPQLFRLLKSLNRKVFLVVDDIQAGMYRCRHKMSHLEWGAEYRPDGITLGKALGGGVVSISALLGTEELMDVFKPGSDGSTFGGLPSACAAASAMMDWLDSLPDPGGRSHEVGALIAEQLADIPQVVVKHRGSMLAAQLIGGGNTRAVAEWCMAPERDPQVVIKDGRPGYIRMSPAFLAITDEEIRAACTQTLRPAFERASAQLVRHIGRYPVDLVM